MKAEELRPCDGCHGPLLAERSIQFYVVRVSAVLVKPSAVRAHVGLATMFGGSEVLARVFTPEPEIAQVMGEHDKALYTHLMLCFSCYTAANRSPAGLVEARNDSEAKAALVQQQ